MKSFDFKFFQQPRLNKNVEALSRSEVKDNPLLNSLSSDNPKSSWSINTLSQLSPYNAKYYMGINNSAPLSSPISTTNLQWSVAASKKLSGGNTMATGLNKANLYDAALSATESLSNPVILMLINDGKAILDNKQYADAIPRPNVQSWRTNKQFTELAEQGKVEQKQTGNISAQTAD